MPIPGIAAGDRAIVSPSGNLPVGFLVMPIRDLNSTTRLSLRVCNLTAIAINAPEGGWDYVLFR